MTAVIGMLNKRGVAIAADSAMTRTGGDNKKVTKNGNKIMWVSDVVPVSVMITGSTRFLDNPWNVIIRKFRQERGEIMFSTVEDAAMELLTFLSANSSIWDTDIEERWMERKVEIFMSQLREAIEKEGKFTDDGIIKPAIFVKENLKALQAAQSHYSIDTEGEQKYDFEKFKRIITPYIEAYLDNEENPFDWESKVRIKEHFEPLEEDLINALYSFILFPRGKGSSTLIFSGYGNDEVFPSLIAISINGGFDCHINWEMVKKVNINDKTPAAICPFGQTDVIKALLTGASSSWLYIMDDAMRQLYDPSEFIGGEVESDEFVVLTESEKLTFREDRDKLYMINSYRLAKQRRNSIRKKMKTNWDRWLKELEAYDIKSMAELAFILVNLTALQRILTFQQEGVGGEIDVAVITKTEGFNWLHRKSGCYN